MDNEKKLQLDETVKACTDVLIETMTSADFKEYIILGGRREGDSLEYDVFCRSNSTTMTMVNLFMFLFKHMNDESVGELFNALLSMPEIMAKMAVYQARMMAKRAEELKAKAAASPEPQQQPAPKVQDKNKSWLN